jgi:hypothetical protein
MSMSSAVREALDARVALPVVPHELSAPIKRTSKNRFIARPPGDVGVIADPPFVAFRICREYAHRLERPSHP